MRHLKGFTLIELLIVVAIIAILAAIAVPNFIEAQMRSKVSRCKADMRSLTTALESYAVDWNGYPVGPDQSWGNGVLDANAMKGLTSPVSYIASIPLDQFPIREQDATGFHLYAWAVDPFTNETKHRSWGLRSPGPDMVWTWGAMPWEVPGPDVNMLYDSTNGTKSRGDVWRFGGEVTSNAASLLGGQ